MIRASFLTALTALVFGASAVVLLAQAPSPAATNAAPRRPQGPPQVRSAEIGADRRVTFRLRATNATEVILSGQWPQGRVPMIRETNGLWTVTVGPVDPGVWEYSFQVDGLSMIDPGNPAIKPMREPRTSILHLPADPPALHDFQDVPHGTVHFHSYASHSLDRLRELVVYTPPDYGRRTGRKYPTLYLQHGSGDNHATWVLHGKAHWILDNLIAQARAVPMVVVMMDGHAALPGAGGGTNNTPMFQRDMLEDVLPFVEANYRVKSGPGNRAIVGLSMGGGQSLTIGLNHPRTFAWVGGFSAAVPGKDNVAAALDHPDATNHDLKLLWIACGKDDFLLQRNQDFMALLEEKKIRHDWKLTEGNHSWPVWRTYLGEFVPLLFR